MSPRQSANGLSLRGERENSDVFFSYEQNNVLAFKRMFLEQVEFAVREYF